MASSPTFDVRGLWVPIVTPFDAAGEVDLASLERLGIQLLTSGVDGLIALGTTGEPATLSRDERRRVVEVCDRICRDAGKPLMVGAGTNSTQGTMEEIHLLSDGTGVRAALVVVPYYTRPSEAAIVEHFETVAAASAIPLLAYNIPYRTGRGLGASSLLELAQHPRIIGLKQAVGGLDLDTLQLLAGIGTGFEVLCGDDAFITPTIAMGGTGAIAAAAHLCTGGFVSMTNAARAEDMSLATAIAAELLPVVVAGFSEPSPAVWKGVLASIGTIGADRLRRPMVEASLDSVARVLALAEKATRAIDRLCDPSLA